MSEKDWTTILTKLNINPAELVSMCPIDSRRRVYIFQDQIYKISLLNGNTNKKSREQTLAGEFSILEQCSSIPGIPKVTGYQINNYAEVLALQLIPGKPLDQIPITKRKAISILRKLGLILFRLSKLGISHNDILPQNIFLSDDGEIYLLDFDQAIHEPFWEAILNNFLGTLTGKLLRGYQRLINLTTISHKMNVSRWRSLRNKYPHTMVYGSFVTIVHYFLKQ